MLIDTDVVTEDRRMNEYATRAAYDTVANLYADVVRGTEFEQPAELSLLGEFCEQLRERRVLDAGCGAGRLLPLIASHGCVVEGVDISDEMVRRARQDHPHFVVQQGSLADVPCADATFAGVVSWYSTIHATRADLSVMLSEFRRVLTPDGRLLLAFQEGTGSRDAAPAYRARGYDISLVRYLRTAGEMSALLRSAGFCVEQTMVRPAVGNEPDPQAVIVCSVARD